MKKVALLLLVAMLLPLFAIPVHAEKQVYSYECFYRIYGTDGFRYWELWNGHGRLIIDFRNDILRLITMENTVLEKHAVVVEIWYSDIQTWRIWGGGYCEVTRCLFVIYTTPSMQNPHLHIFLWE